MKAVLYCRVDGPQTSFALDAIKGQQLYLMDYAKKNNIEIAGIYLDKLLLPLMQLRDNSYISWTMRRKTT